MPSVQESAQPTVSSSISASPAPPAPAEPRASRAPHTSSRRVATSSHGSKSPDVRSAVRTINDDNVLAAVDDEDAIEGTFPAPALVASAVPAPADRATAYSPDRSPMSTRWWFALAIGVLVGTLILASFIRNASNEPLLNPFASSSKGILSPPLSGAQSSPASVADYSIADGPHSVVPASMSASPRGSTRVTVPINLHHVDWFSGTRGAVIIPEYTSKTLMESPQRQKAIDQLARASSFLSPRRYLLPLLKGGTTNYPFKVLTPWTEGGECWCAEQAAEAPIHPNSDKAMLEDHKFMDKHGVSDPRGPSLPGAPRAQFAVAMGTPIYPTEAVIEHVPAQGTPDIASAPEWIEIFIFNTDPTNRDAIWHAWSMTTGDLLPPWPEYTKSQITMLKDLIWTDEPSSIGLWFNYWFGKRSPLVDEIPYAGATPLNKNWVRVARFRYDIHAASYIQAFPLGVDFEKLGIPVDQMAVRVRTNYGGEYTCLYRVRMHGKQVHA